MSLCGIMAVGVVWQTFPGYTPPQDSLSGTDNYQTIYEHVKSLQSRVWGDEIVDDFDNDSAVAYPTGIQLPESGFNNSTYYESGVKGTTVATAHTGSAGQNDPDDTPDHSDTNVQVEGVQEADIVKTDGSYIYTVSHMTVSIIKAESGKLTLVSQFEVGNDNGGYCAGMYVTDTRLVLVREEGSRTVAEIYDITNHREPRFLNTYGQSGTLLSSRMVGDILYLTSNYTIYEQPVAEKPETFVPQTYTNEEGNCIPADDILINEDDSEERCTYLVVSGLDTANVRAVSQKSLLGYGGNLYCSTQNLYVAGGVSLDGSDGSLSGTKLYRFALDKGVITPAATGTVSGMLLNQFSMDEHEGYLRLVTTLDGMTQSIQGDTVSVQRGESTQRLYVLNDKLGVTGQVKDLAPGERVYSVRFDGDIGYFVTFRQTDPLFAADLSDPQKPRILSALEIPGFSEYLHLYDDGLLLGLGRDADENGVQSGWIKLSMFDVSDPSAVSQAHTLVLDDCFYSVAEYDHKAILVDAQRNLIAFPGSGGDYRIYGYSPEEGFTCRAVLTGFAKYDVRGLYIGNYFYVISPERIVSYSMTNFEYIAELRISTR
jgi:uncharacterized secreted protein with C-terminal beta-propeller domain